MDDTSTPISAKPQRFIGRLMAFIRARNLAYKTERNIHLLNC